MKTLVSAGGASPSNKKSGHSVSVCTHSHSVMYCIGMILSTAGLYGVDEERLLYFHVLTNPCILVVVRYDATLVSRVGTQLAPVDTCHHDTSH